MEYTQIGELTVSNLALGCMRIGNKSEEEVYQLILAALDAGINLFDHADIYYGGKSEKVFGQVLANHPELREKIVIQTKCGIVPGVCFDLSKEHILKSVDDSLKRLNVDCIDILLLHRMDPLMDINEVKEAFDELKAGNKVKYFGLSNALPSQFELLSSVLNVPLMVNQVEFSPAHTNLIDQGIFMNIKTPLATSTDGNLIDYAMMKKISIQAWSPIRESLAHDTFLDNQDYAKLNEVLDELSQKYQVSKGAIVVAWIKTHPAKITTVIGTTTPVRIAKMAAGMAVNLTRQEWYSIYTWDKKLP
ncbi:MAG: aldo/keto reductase [Erysipelotrichaceae bacterium]|nr:aldo/keto reductase [Erysipelotrichaceae bacterium]MDD3810393.1 aldo/keto reductase [Erysipelotrichaceae bacterium]